MGELSEGRCLNSGQEGRVQRQLALSMLAELQQCFELNHNLSAYMAAAQQLLGQVLNANHLSLTQYNQDDNTIQFIFSANAAKNGVDNLLKYPLAGVSNSPSSWIIQHRQALLLSVGDQLSQEQLLWFEGGAEHLIGQPMLCDNGDCLGALVLLSYEASVNSSTFGLQVFRLFAEAVNRAVEKYTALTVIDEYIFSQTEEAEKQLTIVRKAENLQQALYEITATTHRHISLLQLYKKAHQILDTLLDASNIGIVRYTEELDEFCHAYLVDEREQGVAAGTKTKFGPGFSSYIIRRRLCSLFTREIASEKLSSGELQGTLGDQSFYSWIGAPMISGDTVYGVIYVQSYHPEIDYGLIELDILQFFAGHLASAIAITQEAEQALSAERDLERQQRLLRSQNRQLGRVLDQLHSTEKELVQKQKMASLQALVAAVALHINTPLSSSLHTVQQLAANNHNFQNQLQTIPLSKQALESYLKANGRLGEQLSFNLQRAAKLIDSFKQVAVNQSANELRQVGLKKFLETSLLSLQPQLMQIAAITATLKLSCDASISIYCNANALSQVLEHLIINSYQHAFSDRTEGAIEIAIEDQDDRIYMTYKDDGVGMSQQELLQLFEPFFSSSTDPEHCGLGAHLVYNLVTSSLQGSIAVSSNIAEGLGYQIEFPKTICYANPELIS